jgi:hypothetical protein
LTGPDVDFARGFLLDQRPTAEVRERVRRTRPWSLAMFNGLAQARDRTIGLLRAV